MLLCRFAAMSMCPSPPPARATVHGIPVGKTKTLVLEMGLGYMPEPVARCPVLHHMFW